MSLYLPGNARLHDTPLPKRTPHLLCIQSPQPSPHARHTPENPIRAVETVRLQYPPCEASRQTITYHLETASISLHYPRPLPLLAWALPGPSSNTCMADIPADAGMDTADEAVETETLLDVLLAVATRLGLFDLRGQDRRA